QITVIINCLLKLTLQAMQAIFTAFLDKNNAAQVLSRRRRANSFLEELKQGNMERECNEERCSLEEAREIFEDADKTNDFWAVYIDGDACKSIPCANNGRCKDGIGTYTCFCPTGYQGFNCEIVIPQLCEKENGGCEHFCHVVRGNVQCSCAGGYSLASDDKSCHSSEKFRCGGIVQENTRTVFLYDRVSSDNQKEERIISEMAQKTRIVNGENCPPGECPWQAVLMNEDHRWFCGGTILNQYIILTAAHCMNETNYFYVKLGEFDMLVDEGNEAIHEVETILAHNKYLPDTYHNDIALIKLVTPITYSKFILPACIPEQEFAESVLMQQPDGMISGFGRFRENRPTSNLQRLTIPYVDRRTCIESTSLRISTRMFCAGYDDIAKDACQGDSGGPHVTSYRDTYFVTGIVSWGEGCARKGKYGVYTQVSKYIGWIHDGIKRLVPHEQSTRSKR
uniref:coagulation factor Xa n=1 Tax=Tetraodon nigroviridis TaxID=99883 RepID=H3C0R5_TETNG